jgi:TRAP-type C4-dicarboxylate transport system permease small subunit
VSEPADGDGSDKAADKAPDKAEAVPQEAADVPPTRKHEALPPADEPPARISHLSIEVEPSKFPDDGPASKLIRKIDHVFGSVEQAVLFGLLAAVVLTAATAALSDKIAHHHIGRWWFTVVRGGTFAIAMFGAVYATHQQRHLAMDLISRRISPRARLVLGVVLKVFTIAIAVLLYRSGMHQRETVGGGVEDIISDKAVVTTLPIGAVLIIFHSLLHIAIDVEYLVRGKLPPEKARTGH